MAKRVRTASGWEVLRRVLQVAVAMVAMAWARPGWTEPARAESKLPAYLLGGVGLAGAGGFALLTYWGTKDNELLDACAPDCPLSRLEHIRRLYLAADVSLAVGIAAMATSVWLLATSGGNGSGDLASSRRARVVNVELVRAGAVATVGGTF